MARKRSRPADAARPVAQAPVAAPAATPPAGETPEPATGAGTAVVLLLATAVFLAPAVGSPTERLLQDTLKSAVVAFAALLAALLFFWQRRRRPMPLQWHPVVWGPVVLCATALASMAWSHAYLGGVEAIRWFLFALLLWLGLNTLSRERLPLLAWGVHLGAFVASLWAVLQFWFDLQLFPQGPNPASTFVNRNFYAEFAACTLPFSALLLARTRQTAAQAVVGAMLGLVVVAILMTGTRAALVALWLQALLLLPWMAWRYRASLPLGQWRWPQRSVAAGVLLATIVGLGMLPSGNPRILEEGRGSTALERGLRRTGSISPDDPSLQIRRVMWAATLRMIAANPLAGVGSGAWEVQVPLYQVDGDQVETDFYPHNEFLQLLAEDGLPGLLVLLGLFGYLLRSAWVTWRAPADEEGAWRGVALTSLLALMVVSNVGFAWRMASTGALFALSLALLAASDRRLGVAGRLAPRPIAWTRARSTAGLAITGACTLLAAAITVLAVECESKLVRAGQLALGVSHAADPNGPGQDQAKAELLRLVREGIAINPHYRKLTPLVADEMAGWGDWKDATWIWESVLQSRPYVVALLTNVARGHVALGELPQAVGFLARAQAISPDAPSVRSLEVILLARSGESGKALALAREAMRPGRYDFDLLTNAFLLARAAGDFDLAVQAMRQRVDEFPLQRAQGLVQLGLLYRHMQDEPKALDAWRRAAAVASPAERAAVLEPVPAADRARLAP